MLQLSFNKYLFFITKYFRSSIKIYYFIKYHQVQQTPHSIIIGRLILPKFILCVYIRIMQQITNYVHIYMLNHFINTFYSLKILNIANTQTSYFQNGDVLSLFIL